MSIAPLTAAGVARVTAAAQVRRQQPQHQYRIEGEYVSRGDIALRIGVSPKEVSARLNKLKRAAGAITWARLRGESP